MLLCCFDEDVCSCAVLMKMYAHVLCDEDVCTHASIVKRCNDEDIRLHSYC